MSTGTKYEKALQQAKEDLASKGIIDPVLRPGASLGDFYEEGKAYSERLGALTVQYLRMPSGDRPFEPTGDKKTPVGYKSSPDDKPSYKSSHRDWGAPYNDN